LPQSLLQAEVAYVRRLHRALRGRQGETARETAEESAAYEQTAQNRLTRSLILAEVIRANAIKASPDRVRARITEMAQEYEAPEEFVRACYANATRLREIEAAVVEEQATEYLLQTADVSDKPIAFQELVRLAGSSA
jgi:trigger factor